MSVAGRPLDDPASLGRAVDELLATRPKPPALLALGEPTHGVAAFPLLRNDILSHLIDRGYRSIALEIDFFAASLVDDYVRGGPGDLDTVLATGFSHGFGTIPGNRELVERLRAHNTDRAPQDHVRFYGFDAPTENYTAPSPRHALRKVTDYLPKALHPDRAGDLDALLGADTDWETEKAAFDPATSVGGTDRAMTLRVVADDLASALRRAAPALRATDPAGYDLVAAHARTALSLLRYHAVMATSGPNRIGTLLSVRAEMMADNLLGIIAQERRRGPTLVFANNAHLRRSQSEMPFGGEHATWASAGALVALPLGERYVFVATDGHPHSEPGTFQGMLAEATTRRALFPTAELRAAVDPSTKAGEPMTRGHFPLTPAVVEDADAVIFITDTDGKQHQYW